MWIQLICIGQHTPQWVTVGFQEYVKRLPPTCHLQLVEIPLQKRSKSSDNLRLQREETKKMLAAITPESYVIALDERGKMWNTVELANNLQNWLQNYKIVTLLVGGPEGLTEDCKQRAQEQWSLSRLTLPHQMVRIIVAEQLYRAWSVLTHHPYHRA